MLSMQLLGYSHEHHGAELARSISSETCPPSIAILGSAPGPLGELLHAGK